MDIVVRHRQVSLHGVDRSPTLGETNANLNPAQPLRAQRSPTRGELSDKRGACGFAAAADTLPMRFESSGTPVRAPSARWFDPNPDVYAAGLTSRDAWRFDARAVSPHVDELIEEVPVALTFAGEAPIVMMATPLDIEDFALGFAITERIVDRADQVVSIDAVPANGGFAVFVELAGGLANRVATRRRSGAVAGACGLCGAGDIAEVLRPPSKLPAGVAFSAAAIVHAFETLPRWQTIGARTGGAHGAALVDRHGTILAFAEDAGRHNALDKLIGQAARRGLDTADAFCAVTSRASFELAQKAAVAGFPMLCAISAPTDLAVRLSKECNLTLCAFVRNGRFACFAVPERLQA
jgi:FdhD protein